jgi:hypothetical protein
MDQYDQVIRQMKENNLTNFAAVAREHELNRSTLSKRYRGKQESASHKAQNQQLLNPSQEQRLLKYIKQLSTRGIPPTPAILRNLAFEISGKEPGVNWPSKFVHRHSEHLDRKFLNRLDRQRYKADTPSSYQDYFQLLQEKVEEHEIEPQNMYNMDEKGFLIGWSIKQQRVFSKGSKVAKGVLHDGNREWITLLACVCADGTPLTPCLIYAGAEKQLQDSWTEGVVPTTNCHFSASPTGWTNDNIALEWMEAIFEPSTAEKAGRKKRLLLLDGHGSHVNMRFLNWCQTHRIIVATYPPHTTHRLQPLDVGLFSPLATKYSQQLNGFLERSQGICGIRKRHFYPLFEPAFKDAFTAANITSSFAKSGLHPFDPSVVIKKLKTPPSSRPTTAGTSSSSNAPKKARKKVRFLDNMVYRAKKEPGGEEKAEQLKSVSEFVSDLAAQNQLQKRQLQGLQEALYIEQNSRSKGKTLVEELRSESQGGTLIFSPRKIDRLRSLNEARAAAKEASKQAKQAAKEAKAIAKQEQLLLKQQAAEERRQQQLSKAAAKAAQKTLEQRLKEAAQAERQLSIDMTIAARTPSNSPAKRRAQTVAISSPLPPILPEEEDQPATRRGRRIKQPQRLKD